MQKATSSKQQQNLFASVQMHQMRRLTLRSQKHQMIMRRLQDIPITYFHLQMLILFAQAFCLVAVQIAMIVKRTPLCLVCAGFWVAGILIGCSVLIYFLGEPYF